MPNAVRFVVFVVAMACLAYFAIDYSDRTDDDVRQQIERISSDLAAGAEALGEDLGEAGQAANTKIIGLIEESDRLSAKAAELAPKVSPPPSKPKKQDEGAGWFQLTGETIVVAIGDLREWMRAKRREWFDD